MPRNNNGYGNDDERHSRSFMLPGNDMSRLRPSSSHSNVSAMSSNQTGPYRANQTNAHMRRPAPSSTTTIPSPEHLQSQADTSIAALNQQIGRLNSTIDMHEATISQLRGQVQAYMQERDELSRELSNEHDRLERSEAEAKRLRELVIAKEGQINELDDKVRKMQTTIKVQSDQISSKPPSTATPQRNAQRSLQQDGVAAPNNGNAGVYNQPPPSYDVRGNPQASSFAPPTLRRERSSNMAASMLNPRATYAPPVVHHGTAPRTSAQTYSVPGQHQQQALNANLGTLVIQDGEGDDFDFPSEISRFFKLVEDWARNYANVPDVTKDDMIPPQVLKVFNTASHASDTSSLLASGSTRYFLVARYLNEQLEGELLKIKVIRGSSQQHEAEIKVIRSKMQPKMPLHMRRASLQAIADSVVEVGKIAGFDEWLDHQARNFAKNLRPMLEPLLAPGADKAWEDLQYVVTEAHRIGVKMHTKPYTYTFEYPHANHNSWFNPTLMMNRDRDVLGDPQSIQKARWRVRLTMSPVVVYTDVMGASIIPKTVHLAEVLLSK